MVEVYCRASVEWFATVGQETANGVPFASRELIKYLLAKWFFPILIKMIFVEMCRMLPM
jgi:hypothetical protein